MAGIMDKLKNIWSDEEESDSYEEQGAAPAAEE